MCIAEVVSFRAAVNGTLIKQLKQKHGEMSYLIFFQVSKPAQNLLITRLLFNCTTLLESLLPFVGGQRFAPNISAKLSANFGSENNRTSFGPKSLIQKRANRIHENQYKG